MEGECIALVSFVILLFSLIYQNICKINSDPIYCQPLSDWSKAQNIIMKGGSVFQRSKVIKKKNLTWNFSSDS